MATRRAPWIPVRTAYSARSSSPHCHCCSCSAPSTGCSSRGRYRWRCCWSPSTCWCSGARSPHTWRVQIRESSIGALDRRRVVGFLAQDYLASIFTQATLTVLPLLVIAILGARESAYFAMPLRS